MFYEEIKIEDGVEYKVTITDDWDAWTLGGKLHRMKGPAVVGKNEPIKQAWWFQGERVICSSQDEFERIVALKIFW
jgi:hypothetical protein